MEEKRKRVQMAFDTTLDIRAEIRILAAKRNITVGTWIKRAIHERIVKEQRENDE